MKKLAVAVFALSAMYMTGCKNNAGDPKAVLSAFFDAMAKKDIPAARKLATADSKQMFDLMEMGMKMEGNKVDEETKDKYDKSKMQIGEAKIDGDRATVNVKETGKGESLDFVLKKEEGSWKVALDMSTLMGMGADKIKEKGMSDEEMQKMQAEMDKFKNMSADSLKMMMNKGMEALDSLKSKMDNK